MHFANPRSVSPLLGLRRALLACVAAVVAGCATQKTPEPVVPAKPAPQSTAPAAKPAPMPPVKQGILPPPATPRSWAEARTQAARRMVEASPDKSYMGKPPEMLLAIPVMTIELNGDGSIQHISVMRYPSQARETVDMAIAAIKRAAPFGDISKLPKPWKFNETFLFNDDRKFKPMTLDQR